MDFWTIVLIVIGVLICLYVGWGAILCIVAIIKIIIDIPKTINEARRKKAEEKAHAEYEEKLFNALIKIGGYYIEYKYTEYTSYRHYHEAAPTWKIRRVWEVVDIIRTEDGEEIVLGEWTNKGHTRVESKHSLRENYERFYPDISPNELIESYSFIIEDLINKKAEVGKLLTRRKGKD